MQHKQLVTLQELRIGDRFSFKKSNEVWQVTNQTGNYTHINKFMPDGTPVYRYDQLKKNTMEAVFLRHTIPAPGDTCKLGQLKEGDRFYRLENVVIEYTVQKRPEGLPHYQVLSLTDFGEMMVDSTERTVVYVGCKKQEVV
jgi:hypothetical protein